RSVRLCPDSAERSFDVQKGAKQLFWQKCGVGFRDRVDVGPGAGRATYGGGFVIRRNAADGHAWQRPQPGNSSVEKPLPVAEVGAEGQVDAGHDTRRNGKRIAAVEDKSAIRAPTSALALLLRRGRLGRQGGCCSRRGRGRGARSPFRGGPLGPFGRLLGLLGLLQDDLLHSNFGQSERAPPL